VSDSPSNDLDLVDYRLLRELADNGRASDVWLGEKINLSGTAVARRRKILESKGVINGYSAKLDLPRLGFNISVIVTIELRSQAVDALQEFEEAVVRCPSIAFCGLVSGETDFLMMLNVRSFEDYDRIYRSELSPLPHVAKIKSTFVMREITRRSAPPSVFKPPEA
jgi:DNA-binding Lrp family transcriptional regulator